MAEPLAWITGCGVVGPFGLGLDHLAATMLSGKHCLSRVNENGDSFFAGTLPEHLMPLLDEAPLHRKTDRSVRLAWLAAKEALGAENIPSSSSTGISIGTSRGPTRYWETVFSDFQSGKPLSPFASPVSTPGAITSEVASALGLDGPDMTVSMTCSSSLVAILNGLAWLRAGWCDHFLAGGAEAALTPFTLAQTRALHLYSREPEVEWPCQPLGKDKTGNTLVLSEGAAVLKLSATRTPDALGVISGFGAAREKTNSPAGISPDGDAFRHAMAQALKQSPGKIDIVLVHAPGTLNGDEAEVSAIRQTFQDQPLPVLYPLKALIGHSYGASGAMACAAGLILQKQSVPLPGYLNEQAVWPPAGARRIMINAAGFGGQCVSLIIEPCAP